MFPTRMTSFLALLAALVAGGVLGLLGYLATAADLLIWLLAAGLVVVIGRGVWRRLRGRWR